MTRFNTVLLSLALCIPALPAAAQPDRPGYGWDGYGHMWNGWMFPGMGMLAAVVCLLALIGVGAVIVWAARGLSHHRDHRVGADQRGRWALDILAERFARGEIEQEEFEAKRRLLGR